MSARKSNQRGLSIIELMVGIVVSMLVGLAAAGSAAMFTASQRQGIGAGGAGIGTATALSALKNDAALAGMGFFGDSNYLCEQLALSVDDAVIVNGTDFSPINITTVGTDSQIDIVYADRVEAGASVLLGDDSDGSTATLMSLLPAQVNQAVLLAKADGSGTCLVRSVTGVTASTETTPQVLTFGSTGHHNEVTFSTPPEFAERDRITLLGALSWNRYRREGNTLVLERPLAADPTAVVLARDVIALRAQYGVSADVAGSTTLEGDWEDATGTFASMDADTLPRVRALRLGMVTRSPQRQKPDTNGDCDASLAKPQLFGETVEPDVSDWQCYRYRVSTVVVPMRNLVLGLAGSGS